MNEIKEEINLLQAKNYSIGKNKNNLIIHIKNYMMYIK